MLLQESSWLSTERRRTKYRKVHERRDDTTTAHDDGGAKADGTGEDDAATSYNHRPVFTDLSSDIYRNSTFGLQRRPMENNLQWLIEHSIQSMQARAVIPSR